MNCNITKIPINSLPIGKDGPIEGLCNSCCSSECPHPIKFVEISVFGIPKIERLYQDRNTAYSVVMCDGYKKCDGDKTYKEVLDGSKKIEKEYKEEIENKKKVRKKRSGIGKK